MVHGACPVCLTQSGQADYRQIQARLRFVTPVNMGLVGCFSDTFLTKYFIFEAKDCVDQVYWSAYQEKAGVNAVYNIQSFEYQIIAMIF